MTTRSVVANFGLYCLPMSILWDSRHEYTKNLRSKLQNLFKSKTSHLRIVFCWQQSWNSKAFQIPKNHHIWWRLETRFCPGQLRQLENIYMVRATAHFPLACQRQYCRVQLKGQEEGADRRKDGKTTSRTVAVIVLQALERAVKDRSAL